MFVTDLKVEKTNGRRKLLAPLIYHGDRVDEVIVNTGFYTDGSSVPRFAWSVVGHPYSIYNFEAGVVHDFLYWEGYVSRKEADLIFREALKCLGKSRIGRFLMYQAVRVGGWKAWNAYRRKEKLEAPEGPV